ncbi:LPXTG cell wall anchor domain-containing protein [Streptomyces sp. MUM 203J]|uniref:LAETG motif-containing sortase-dependent surface protein n=1 Tax=Streptomyces sp. MUM 203J TaxID=2791990 RepID=UPI001F043D03|nr:LAETG motif-containing sortase-dependent surface protein [Streptomyces sp. MUM 203J]MCH0541905.1 LPXTG cell wall anchor domain-containing protein [Streptomyces sp. MUM 203J]
MKIRRSIATAVALAVTAPVTLLAASPAFAETGTTTTAAVTEAQNTDAASGVDLEKLEKAVADAQAAYDAAVAAETEAEKTVEATLSDTAPLAVAYTEAKAAADRAAADKAAADQAVTDAKTALDNMPDDLSDDERVALAKALADAEKAAEAAATAKTTADTAAAEALKARDDQRVEAGRKHYTAQEAAKAAKADLDAAKKALEDAEKDTGTPEPEPDPKPEPKPEPKPGDDQGDDECDAKSKVGVAVSGLPGKVAAGSSVNFTLRITNHSDRTLDYVQPYAAAFAVDSKGMNDISHLLKLQWSDGSGWKSLSSDDMAGEITDLKAGSGADVRLRLSVDAKAPAGLGFAFAAGSYVNEDGTCGWTPEANRYDFDIVAAGAKTGNEPAKPGKPMPMPQGGTSTAPVKAANTAATTGELAATGSSDAMPQIALAGAAAVALGAGAVFVVRRRKAGADA